MNEAIYVKDGNALEKLFDLEGKDRFTDFTFSKDEWSAKRFYSKEDIDAIISSFHLERRVIKSIEVIGYGYDKNVDSIEDHAYDVLKKRGLVEEECQKHSEYLDIDDEITFYRCLETDEPIMIRFEDNDVFEILVPEENAFMMSMNRIPRWTKAGINPNHVDGDVLFSNCIGKKIVSVETETVKSDCDMYGNSYTEDRKEIEVASRIVLKLEGGFGIQFDGFADFFDIAVVDQNGECCPISFRELKPALFNWEDLHIDLITRYKAESSTVFFNDKGAEKVGNPYMTLNPEGSDSFLCISSEDDDDYDLLGISSAISTGITFDIYDDYEYSYAEWKEILSTAERILNLDTFDEFFALLRNLNTWDQEHWNETNYLFWANSAGPKFWNERDKFRKQLEDVKKWTDLVLQENKKMFVAGF
ncbi:MAG: hypothetical protein IJI66_12560 [Erysipelotrichaceae bacterium]|nr:hypothetical protein [Erysipelotrichaceae bacterium]